MLDGALKYRRPRGGGADAGSSRSSGNGTTQNDNFDDDDDVTAAGSSDSTEVELEDDMPVEVRQKMETLLTEFENSKSISVFRQQSSNDDDDKEEDPEQQQQQDQKEEDRRKLAILERLEQFLPNPSEDEEAHKSLWDLVIELHGRESVKSNEMSSKHPTEYLDWKLRNVVARILIHHDFLSLGIVDGPLY